MSLPVAAAQSPPRIDDRPQQFSGTELRGGGVGGWAGGGRFGAGAEHAFAGGGPAKGHAQQGQLQGDVTRREDVLEELRGGKQLEAF